MDRETVAAIVVILILAFLFKGDPDVFDALQAKTIAALSK